MLGAALHGLIDIPGLSPGGGEAGGGEAGGGEIAEPIRAEVVLDPRKPIHQRDIRAIEGSLTAQSSALVGCELGGVDAVDLKLVVDRGGEVLSATASGLDAEARRCVQDAIEALSVRRAGPTAKLSAELRLELPAP